MDATILVVDDHDGTRNLLRRVLTSQGYAVSTVADAEAALAVVAAERPDLVIADVFLPGVDGLTLMGRLRLHDPLLPLIAISAAPDALTRPEAVPAGLDLGQVPFLAKPFALANLLEFVAHVLPNVA